ncbi:UNVERIFIED_CONTAM: movement protein [Sesamum calycinum]|uniref:Movement protein n=1 Tax=Sesamum calycinum TaxID=2727403 RepID=A0AAW2SYD1_9LAMI
MSFLKDKLKDWCYQASIQKNMKRLRGTIKRTPLCCDNNDFPTIIGESGEPRKRRKQSNDSYSRNSRRTPFRRRSWWSKTKARTYKSGQMSGTTRASSQGSRRTDTRSTGRTPTRRTFRRAIPGLMKVSKTATAGRVEQENDGVKQNHGKSQDSNLSPYDGFRIGGIGKVLNQIGLNQRKHHIIYKVSSGEFAIPMEYTGNVMEMQLIPREEILEELSRLREEVAVTMKWIHIGTIEVVRKATFKEGIDSEIHLSIMDRRINNLRDGCLGTMIGNLYAGKLMFDIHPRIAYNLADQDFSRVLTLHQNFKRKDLMKEGNRPYSITYRIAYALSNTHHSNFFLRKEYIEIPRIFKEFTKVMAPDPIRMPRIGGVDIVIKDQPVLDRTISSRTEFSSRMSFSEDRIMSYKGKEKDLLKAMTPQEIRQPVVGRYEGMLEIAGHEILVAGVAGRENGSMTLGLSFLEDHKPWGRKGNGQNILQLILTQDPEFAQQNLEFSLKKQGKPYLLLQEEIFHKNPNTQYGDSRSQKLIGGAFGTPWFRVKTPPIYFHDTGADILLGNNFIQTFARYMQDNQRNLQIFTTNCGSEIQVLRREEAFNRIMPINFRSKRGDFDAKLTHPKMQDKRKFGKVLLSFRQQGLIDSDSFYEESEEEIKNLKEALQELKTMDISEESKLSLENVKRLIQRNFSKNLWHDEHGRKKDMQMIIKEHINLGLIEPGISAYSSPGFLEHIVEKIRNFPDILKDKKLLQSFLGLINFAGFFIKDLAKYRKDFRPLLKETESAKWKWEEIHTQRVRELKQVCNNLPKLAIPQDEDELVVYTDANDYRWAAVLMKRLLQGKNLVGLGHLRENLEELNKKFGWLAVNAQVAGQIQRADLDTVQIAIRTTMVASTSLWNDLQELIRKASSSEMTNELRKHDPIHALRVQDSRPVAADSSTACTRPSPDSGATATNESKRVQTSDDSSQPSASGVKEEEISLKPMTGTSKANTNELSSSSSAWQDYQRMWEKLISRKGVNPSKTIIETSEKYNRVWMMESSKPEEVREWYEFGALASVHTMSPSFLKISKLPEWISGAVYDSWKNNPHLKRGDILELKFISAAPKTAGKGSHPAFHFIKLQRPDMVAFNRIKAASEEAPLVSAISEDDISTRRAWGLWVCLIEMDKVKYPFKSSPTSEWIIPVKLHDRENTEFAESMFEKKRMLIWENKLPATEVTRMKTCNMLHVGNGITMKRNRVVLFVAEEPNICEPSAAVVWLEEVRKNESLEYPETRRSEKGVDPIKRGTKSENDPI